MTETSKYHGQTTLAIRKLMIPIDLTVPTDHERVVEWVDESSGYHGFIAVHSTRLGPGVGGTRLLNYATRQAALDDALRLSRAMSLKAALAGVPFGGGKAVVIGDARTVDREALFRIHGQFIHALEGSFITGEDVGTSPSDMAIIRRETPYAAGTTDPSPSTARGVVEAMRGAAEFLWGSDDLGGRTVALQGCGNVGFHLAGELAAAGVSLLASDIDPERVDRVVRTFGARAVAPDAILDVEADILAPCALGAILSAETVPRLRVAAVVGAANNQLRDDNAATLLSERNILHVPDFVASAGGIIDGTREICGWSELRAAETVRRIRNTTVHVLELSTTDRIPPTVAAERLAWSLLSTPRTPT